MMFWEAMREMQNGKRVKQTTWDSQYYIYHNKKQENIVYECGMDYNGALHSGEEWEVVADSPISKGFLTTLKEENANLKKRYAKD